MTRLPASDARRLHHRQTLFLLIAPSAAAALFITVVPVLLLVRMSLSSVSRFGRIGEFVGLRSFARLMADPLLPDIALRTVIWTGTVVAGTVFIALPTALVLNRRFFGRGLAQFLVLAPWAISVASFAVIWRRVLSDEAGLLNQLALATGLIERPVVWLGSVPASFAFEILVAVLVSIPFSTVILLAGLSSIPATVSEAARLDGAGAGARLRLVTLPLLKPFIGVVLIFNVAYVTNSFPIIWIITQGGPANGTDILVTYLYKLAFTLGRLDEAAALSFLLFCALGALTVLLLRMLERPAHD
ncbi:carbohydrate ABC transporter permease [Ancylobacter sp.]|uniref:carbohydrate ABC transporter permease n=1 Tax=Ancylobacter sp. TaxID=1872567 RepID=UPI003D10B5C7